AVNLASRIQTVAEPGTICMSEHTFLLVRRGFTCHALGAKPLKGFAEPQPVYQVVGARENSSERGLAEHDTIVPLVGGAQQLSLMKRAIDDLETGRGGLLVITGEAGIGKSRLLDEARDAASGAVTWLQGNTLSFGQRISYWPFIEMLRPA